MLKAFGGNIHISEEMNRPNNALDYNNWLHVYKKCHGGGQVVSVLAFYSDDPSSNPAEVYSI